MTDPVSAMAEARAVRGQHLQALEDALRYRRTRVTEPCADCSPDGRCVDHGRDADLISEYERTAGALLATAGASPS